MTIEDLVRRALGSTRVVRVETEADTDREGNAILRVRVIYSEEGGPLDVGSMLDLPGEIRTQFAHTEDVGYPVVSYVDFREAPALHAAQ